MISWVKEFFLMTTIWPHFICISLHQSRQRPSSRPSVCALDSLSHRGDKAHTWACNRLISFRACGFTLRWPGMARTTAPPLRNIWFDWSLLPSFLFHQTLDVAKGHLWGIQDLCLCSPRYSRSAILNLHFHCDGNLSELAQGSNLLLTSEAFRLFASSVTFFDLSCLE